jgi:hypothetical protein
MGAEGLEPFSPDMDKHGGNVVNWHDSKMPGAQAGAIETETDCQGQLKARALEDLQRAWKSLRRLETLSVDPLDANVAERALAFVDKAFAALEGNER